MDEYEELDLDLEDQEDGPREKVYQAVFPKNGRQPEQLVPEAIRRARSAGLQPVEGADLGVAEHDLTGGLQVVILSVPCRTYRRGEGLTGLISEWMPRAGMARGRGGARIGGAL